MMTQAPVHRPPPPPDSPRIAALPAPLYTPTIKLVPSQSSTAPAPTLENSVGSALHGIGECNPCAWFWKPQGCENGIQCVRCHLCPRGEIKARKKAKQATLRSL